MAELIMRHVSDHPWPYSWCQVEWFGLPITLMSSAIFSMILTAIVLMAVIIPMAQRHKATPTGSANALEALVVFIRDMIAKPALHEKALNYLPFLLTLFVYVLGMNLMGMVPLQAIVGILGLPPIGHTATSVPTVCAGLASLALLKIVVSGLLVQVHKIQHEKHWAFLPALLVSPMLWFRSLSPEIPGPVGQLLAIPLALLELVGAIAKCFSLMIRLCANMLSGHTLLVILLMFVLEAVQAWVQLHQTQLLYVGPLVVLGSVAVNLLEILVAGLQAYIFTFLTAMFLGLYAEAGH
jgi:F-type H+-transporting ATPase subunit a